MNFPGVVAKTRYTAISDCKLLVYGGTAHDRRQHFCSRSGPRVDAWQALDEQTSGGGPSAIQRIISRAGRSTRGVCELEECIREMAECFGAMAECLRILANSCK